jgi:DUF1009 family protein
MLGIIAGGGDAPKRLMAACRKLGRDFCFIALQGQTDPDIGNDDRPHLWLPLGAVEKAIAFGHQHGVKDVIWLGRVKRPHLSDLKPDALLMRKLMHLAPAFLFGDDGLLKAVANEFEAEGFRVVAPQAIYGDMLMPAGALTKKTPDAALSADLALGFKEAKELGKQDIGQAVVVQQGEVLAREDAEHTNALIKRAGALKKPGAGPVLVKVKKPQQDSRFDLPSIGVDTVKEAIAAGFAGIAAEAGVSLLIDRDEAVRLADDAGIFVVGMAA